jgi:hypothetical protein
MKMLMGGGALAAAALALSLFAENPEAIVVKKPFGQHKEASKTNDSQIQYHGGPLLFGTVPIYVIYYGAVGSFPVTTQPIVNNFLVGLGGTAQFKVNATYCNFSTTSCPGSGTSISGSLAYDSSHIFFDSGSQGASLGNASIPKVLQNALTASSGHLPADDSAVYILITAPDVKVSGFCTSYCAYHTVSTSLVSGHKIHYALAPEPNSKCTVCDGNFAVYGQATTPNGDAGADEIVDSLMHELSETVTDPNISAWYTSNGSENGDLCNYVYGSDTFASPTTGATANAQWNGFSYLIQLIWENRPLPQGCAAKP